MHRTLRSSFVLIAAAGLFSTYADEQEGRERPHMAGYFTDWAIYSGYYPKNLITAGSADKLTHILYAFANLPAPSDPGAGTCQLGDPWADYEMPVDGAHSIDGVADSWGTLSGNFNQLLKLKKHYPNLKLMISVGGWTWSAGFSSAASTAASRKALVASCIDTFIRGNFVDPANFSVTQPGLFDGIDIDWEYPGACGNTCAYSPDDTVNFTLLLQEFRRQLDAEGAKNHTHYLLSIAAPSDKGTYSLMQLSKIHRVLDFINLMTYDMHGAWDNHADHAAPLFTAQNDPLPDDKGNNGDAAVTGFLADGVPAAKINLGIPFYGHGWSGVPGYNNGLYQAAAGTAPHDQPSYNQLKALSGFTHHYDPGSGLAHWIYNPMTDTFYSYDDAVAVFAKALYVRTRPPRGLGGAMFWELSGDDANGTLVKTLYSVLH